MFPVGTNAGGELENLGMEGGKFRVGLVPASPAFHILNQISLMVITADKDQHFLTVGGDACRTHVVVGTQRYDFWLPPALRFVVGNINFFNELIPRSRPSVVVPKGRIRHHTFVGGNT